jgi:hypothetical protein
MKGGALWAAAAVALIALGFGLGRVSTGDKGDGLRVNGSDVASLVNGEFFGLPHYCKPLTEDGIGEWTCRAEVPPPSHPKGIGPQVPPLPRQYAVTLGRNGEVHVLGETTCCVKVRD